MVDSLLIWPGDMLTPAQILANPVPFTRSGGRSLGGIERTVRTDRGYWAIDYKGVTLNTPERRRMWNAIRTSLNGRSGLVAVPVWSFDSAGWVTGSDGGPIGGPVLTTHSDGTPHSDGSQYSQPGILAELVTAAEIGDVEIVIRIVGGIADVSGVRFSYQHALYETGVVSSIDGDEWTLEIFPEIRAAIPSGAALEFDLPTCLVHLAQDRSMDVSLTAGLVDTVGVSFIEAVDYWNDLAEA